MDHIKLELNETAYTICSHNMSDLLDFEYSYCVKYCH
jgi:hypothetical protein